MSMLHVQFGFDLKLTKSYKTPERAVFEVQKALKPMLDNGTMFNVLIVAQRKGGMGTDAEDLRYVPLLSSFRGGDNPVQASINAARLGFTTFA